MFVSFEIFVVNGYEISRFQFITKSINLKNTHKGNLISNTLTTFIYLILFQFFINKITFKQKLSFWNNSKKHNKMQHLKKSNKYNISFASLIQVNFYFQQKNSIRKALTSYSTCNFFFLQTNLDSLKEIKLKQ